MIDDVADRVAKAAAEQSKRQAAAKRRERLRSGVARSAYSVTSFAAEIDKDPATIFRWIAKGVIKSVRFKARP
jgi:hypothetical protein